MRTSGRADDAREPAAPALLDVDGDRPAVARVAALRVELTAAERLVLFALACDSYDGKASAPGYENLIAWTGLHRTTVVTVLAALLDDKRSDGRPALLRRTATTRGGRRTVYGFLLPEPVVSDNRSSETTSNRSPYRSPNRSSEATSNRSSEATPPLVPPLPYPPAAPAAPGGGTAHEYEPNTRRALTSLVDSCHLPLGVDELVEHAYRLGRGDPWDGYLEMKDKLVQSLDGARDAAAVLRSRLGIPNTRRAA